VGRQEVLATLHQELGRNGWVSVTALVGMGGIGKTELTVQYARQHVPDYPGGVCWLHARTGDLLAQVIAYAQNTLGLDVPQEYRGQLLTLEQQLQWCWHYWEPAGRVLLVLDDVTDLTACQPIFVAPPERFRIVLTTRRRGLDPGFFELSLDVLSPDDACTLLAALVGQDRVSRERATADALCQWLGYLPLGLELVGRYLAQDRGLSLTEMWEQLQEAEQPLEDASLEGGYPLMTAQGGVRAAFELSWHELDMEAQAVAQLLSLCAPAAVPWELATQVMQQVKGETYRIRSARRQLDNLNLVQPVEGVAEGVKLHPLIREFLQEKQGSAADPLMTQEELKRALTRIMVEMAQGISQRPTQETIQALLPMMPHLAEVAEQYTACLADDEILWPFVGLGRFYAGQGLYTLAEPWYEVCLKKTQERFGEEHPDVATSLNNLAVLYAHQGRYSEAEPLYRDAVAMRKRLLGEDHPNIATSLNNLAWLYDAQGHYSEAEPLYQRALILRERVLGPDHPDVAESLNNLAELYRAQRRYSEAEPLCQRALALRERVLGPDHPDVATSLNNLAGFYDAQGRYSEAEPLCQRTLALRERVLGPDHPDVATSLNNLALLYHAQGRYREAEPLCQRALILRERVLGPDHPDVATSLNTLAGLYDAQGHYSEAEPLYQRALTLRERVLGPDHPDVATSLNNLALLYADQEQFEKAAPLLEQALRIVRQWLGEKHPSTQILHQNLEWVKTAMR
jgi:tetratricopeptide (TPR) repeat protein